MGGNPRHLLADRAARSGSVVGADLPVAQTAAIAIRTPMENRIALYPSSDDRRTLRFGSVTGSVLHASLVTGRDASIIIGFERFSEKHYQPDLCVGTLG